MAVISGTSGMVYRTTNSGASWATSATSGTGAMYDIAAANSSTVLTVGADRALWLSTNANAGFTFTDAAVDGVALWARHDQWRLPLLRELALLPRLLQASGPSRLPRLMRGYETLKRRHPRAPHYYLYLLGVRADRQGRGLGRALMRPMLERCDDEGMPAYLESSKPENVPFYASLGFVAHEPLVFGRGGPSMVPMWREPHARGC